MRLKERYELAHDLNHALDDEDTQEVIDRFIRFWKSLHQVHMRQVVCACVATLITELRASPVLEPEEENRMAELIGQIIMRAMPEMHGGHSAIHSLKRALYGLDLVEKKSG